MESDLQVVHLSAGAKVVTCFWSSQATSYPMERSPTRRALDVGQAGRFLDSRLYPTLLTPAVGQCIP